ncbi:bifunctional phosphoribosyl-AMP cyclohydrolase/phosphoribosyl-ATP diphosphatase HisIE [Buchnera aphidicola]|uniref:bifunctional phosphoribosyl-AMP cyclohydrolase/phosphoribosyl-ATP diphosphatase HisIE n=1 Tax=Buchnera aphidicola TaxID=9 RepID=UPI00346443F6
MLNDEKLSSIDWEKVSGLIPCIIQNIFSSEVLMHGYMNPEALSITQKEKKVTFYSRTKKRLWTKGEKSKNFLNVVKIILDCDQDSLLILVNPINQTCHLNENSCFIGQRSYFTDFFYLEKNINAKKNSNCNLSYTARLHSTGISRIAQKLGEEAVELVISSLSNNRIDIINESSDLIYHLIVLLHQKDLDFLSVIKNLIQRISK